MDLVLVGVSAAVPLRALVVVEVVVEARACRADDGDGDGEAELLSLTLLTPAEGGFLVAADMMARCEP